MSNDPHFWIRSRKNLNNPTFSSSQIISTLQPLFSPNMSNLKSISLESKSQIYNSAHFTLPNLKNRQRPSAMMQSGNSVMNNYTQLNQSQMTPNMARSNSYTHVKTDVRDIFQNQQKNFNIISLKPKIYKSSINLFPKYRLERMDSDYKLRQAYLKGDLQAVKNIKNLTNPQSKVQDKNYSPLLTKNKKSSHNFDINQKVFVNNSSKLQWKF